MKVTIKNIKTMFAKNAVISTDDLYRVYQSEEPEINKSTVNWRIYKLVQDGILQRIGKGIFILGSPIHYLPQISKKETHINQIIKKEFPFINYCIGETSKINELTQHQLSFQCLIIEVEKQALESVYYTLKDSYNLTFKQPSRQMLEEFIMTSKNSIIINPLVSEAPIQFIKNIPTPTLEKLLVDLYCEKDMFYFLQGNELITIYKNAFNTYTINRNKLLRYARRRQKRMQITEILQSIIPYEQNRVSQI